MHSAFSESMHEKILEFDHMHENKKKMFLKWGIFF